MNQKTPSLLTACIVTGIISLYGILNIVWLNLDTVSPSWDESNHLSLTLTYFTRLHGIETGRDLLDFLTISPYYPPLYYLTTIPFLFGSDFSADRAIMVNLLYLAILVLSVYATGKTLFDRSAAVVSILLVLFYPVVYALFRVYMIDFALMAMIAGVHYLMLRWDRSGDRKNIIFLGVAIGLSFLMKHTSAAFIYPAFLYVCFRRFRDRRVWAGFLLANVIALCIAGVWYGLSIHTIYQNASKTFYAGAALENDPTDLSHSLLWYYHALKKPMMSVMFFLFFLMGCVSFLISFRKNRFQAVYLALWILPALLAFALIPNKDARYIMPVLPALALVTAGGISRLSVNRNIIRSIFLIIGIGGLLIFLNLSFGMPPFVEDPDDFYYNSLPNRENWMIPEFIRQVQGNDQKERVRLGVVPDTKYFNASTFSFYAKKSESPIEILSLGEAGEITHAMLRDIDYVIVKSGDISLLSSATFRREFVNTLTKSGDDAFCLILLQETPLPDNSTARLYRRSDVYKPDLVIQSISTNQIFPVVRDIVDVTITVKNQCIGDATDGFRTDFYQHSILSPSPGESGDIHCNFTGLSAGATAACTGTVQYNTEGVYTMWAQADTGQQVDETNEANNVSGLHRICVIDTGEVLNLARGYYNSILDRAPEPGEAEGWTAEIMRMASLGIEVKEGFIALADLFFQSEEYLLKDKKDAEYIIDLYETFLGRTPSPDEVDIWAEELAAGLTRNLLMNYFIFSEEFSAYMEESFGNCRARPEYGLVNDLYRGFLGRLPDTEGFKNWLFLMHDAQCTGEQAVRGHTRQIAAAFLLSDEYAARNSDNSEYIEDLYNGILRRGADLKGYRSWLHGLNDGSYTREELLDLFMESTETGGRFWEVRDAGCIHSPTVR